MSLTAKITSKIASRLVKPGTRSVRMENGVKIIKFEKTGTEAAHLSDGIKAVKPGEGTKLGKMGIEYIHSYKPNTIIPSKETLYSVSAKGAKKPMGLLNADELKSWIGFLDDLKKAEKQAMNNPVIKEFQEIVKSFKL